MKYAIFASLIFSQIFFSPLRAAEHTEQGSKYGSEGIEIYTQMRHGPDGALFLDPYFVPYLTNVKGETLLDAGCGAGPWSIVAAQNGAIVYGIDIQGGMIEKAKSEAQKCGVAQATHFEQGDVAKLPYTDCFFDRAVSINVGCNLPSLESHISELYRVLKKGGIVIIAAPNSFGTVFTDGCQGQEGVIEQIQQCLCKSGSSLPESIKGLKDVYRATIAKRKGQWSLILDESQLIPGEEIWRKIPGMVVPNRYHPEEEYLHLLMQEGFYIRKICRPHFSSEAEWECYHQNHHATLGKEYIDASPFVLFIAEK